MLFIVYYYKSINFALTHWLYKVLLQSAKYKEVTGTPLYFSVSVIKHQLLEA